jgi:hypothetical protein
MLSPSQGRPTDGGSPRSAPPRATPASPTPGHLRGTRIHRLAAGVPRALPAAACLVVLAALLVVPRPAAADDVHLTNGRAFENVVAEVVGDRVAIRLPSGVIRIPKSKVARIERKETALETFLDRRFALVEHRGSAADWLELARWARDHGLDSGYLEAARRAADLDPKLEGLAPLMRDLGLLFDEDSDRWRTESEIMLRRGYVRYHGAWVTAVERAEAEARAAAAEVARLEARRDQQRDRALVELATTARVQAETAQRESDGQRIQSGYAAAPFVYYTTGYWAPVYPAPGAGAPHGGDGNANDGGGRHHHPEPQPSSKPPEHNRGSFRASDWIPGRLNPGAAPPPGRITGSTARRQ